MKRIILLALILSGTINTEAQTLSGGLRGGISNWLVLARSGGFVQEAKDGDAVSWDKEAFIRYQTKGRLAFEVAGNTYNREKESYANVWGCNFGGSPYDSSYTQVKYRSTELNISLQYQILTNCTKKCPFFKNITNYIGIVASADIRNYKSVVNQSSTWDNVPMQTYNEKGRGVYYYFGLTHSLVYKIGEHFNAISAVSLRFNPNNGYYDGNWTPMPNTKLSCRAGISYNIIKAKQ